MKATHIPFPKIKPFRETVRSVQSRANYVGKDESGETIYDGSRPKPILEFKGTVKLHGTNAGISYNPNIGIWAQSRSNIITVEKDNAGFAAFVEETRDWWEDYFSAIFRVMNIPDTVILTIFGEWAGKGIQKGVGISEIERAFFSFGLKATLQGEESEKSSYWIDGYRYGDPTKRIFRIEDFPSYSIKIDFNTPELVQNELIRLTDEVENECPVAKNSE